MTADQAVELLEQVAELTEQVEACAWILRILMVVAGCALGALLAIARK